MRAGIAWLTVTLVLAAASPSSGQSARDIAKQVFPSVVLLVMENAAGQASSLGSGFFVREDVVATSLHVVEGAAKGYARLVGQDTTYSVAGTLGMDRSRDVVLLKVSAVRARPLPLGDAGQVSVGDTVYAVGNPQGFEGTFSQGIVSGLRYEDSGALFQITAPISKGSSGGPVLDARGRAIGIAFATVKDSQNLNFAIPISYLLPLLAHPGPLRPLDQTAARTAHEAPTLSTPDGAVMVLIPMGTFTRGAEGADSKANSDETPARKIFLKAYYIDKYEVSNAQFAAFIEAKGYFRPELWSREGWLWRQSGRTMWMEAIRTGGPGTALAGVSWYEADAYCRWAEKRLPTEAEWEKAARGDQPRVYPWGASWGPEYAHADSSGPSLGPVTVGSYPQGVSPYGIHDMAGNVLEWTADWYDPHYYGYSPDRNPLGPPTGERKVLRGGYWKDPPNRVRTTYRSAMLPVGIVSVRAPYPVVAASLNYAGIRCAKDAIK